MKLNADELQKRRDYYQANKQMFFDKAKAWKLANPEKARKSSLESAKRRSRESVKNNELQTKYGLSWDEYVALYELQNSSCAICRSSLLLLSVGKGNKTANVDHCHITGKIRGLLCNNCNRGIGYLKDSTTILKLATEYLENHNAS